MHARCCKTNYNSSPISQNAAIVEAGLGYSPAPNVSLGIYYAGQLAPNAQENSFNGTVDLKF